MDLATRLATETKRRKGPACTACMMLAGMDAKTRVLVQEYLDNPEHTTAAISRALAPDYRIAADTLGRHRKGECAGL